MLNKIKCKLGFYKFKLDRQKSILRCSHFGLAGIERKRELVDDYENYKCFTQQIGWEY